MGTTKKKKNIWFIIGVFGLLFFAYGSINGVRELFNPFIVSMDLAEFMENKPNGSKLELTNCKIARDISVEVSKQKKLSGRKIIKEKFYLLKPKEEVSTPKAYVFVNDDNVGLGNKNASKDYEKKTLDAQGFHGIRGWIELVSMPGLKGKMKELVNNTNAEIVVLKRGFKEYSKAIWSPLIIGLCCFAIIFIRGVIELKN